MPANTRPSFSTRSPLSPRDTTDEVEALAAYRSVSITAIAALLVGLAAPLSLLAPLLISIPVIGIALALAALAKISTSEGRMVGRSLALTGLVLSVITLAAAPARETFTAWLLGRQARPTAERWLTLILADAPRDAFQLTRDADRLPPPEPPGGGPPPKPPLEAFLERPLVQQLVALDDGAVARFERTDGTARLSHGRFQVGQIFTVGAADSPAADPVLSLRILLERERALGDTPPSWRVLSFEDDSDPAR